MRILLADDHGLFLEGLHNLLQAGGYEVVGVAYDGLEALQLARKLHPDLILMDIRMPHCSGLEATRLIKTELPEIQVVILTTSAENTDLFEALKSGASGYLLKNLKPNVLFNYLEGLARGEAPLSRELSTYLLKEFTQQAMDLDDHKRMLNNYPEKDEENTLIKDHEEKPGYSLTTRQREILEMVVAGLSYKEVGAALHLSENTVKYHMGGIIRCLHLKNREQVVAYALSTGLVNHSILMGRHDDQSEEFTD
jgi:two-component system NarL family response regulator